METTKLEAELIYFMENTKSYMDGWFFTNEIKVSGIEKHQMSGVVSSLVKKGILVSDGELIGLVSEVE